MGFFEFLLTGVGLSMDAAAVSATHGLSMRHIRWGRAMIIALTFGIFQGVMPLIGYYTGCVFSGWVVSFANWIAFGLLALVGGKMIWDSFHCSKEEGCNTQQNFALQILVQGIATSIDALAVGLGFAALRIPIFEAVLIISCTTTVISFISVCIGHKLGILLADKAQLVGGVILVLIGLKIALF